MSHVRYPPPHATAETRHYWDQLAVGRWILLFCEDCDRPFFPPQAICPRCWGEQLTWRPARPTGRVVTHAVVHQPGHPAFAADGHYTVAIVQLEEGVRITMSVPDEQRVRVGDPVTIHTRTRDGVTVPVAIPVPGGTGRSSTAPKTGRVTAWRDQCRDC